MGKKKTRKKKPPARPIEPLDPDEIQELLGACSRRSSCGIRLAALIAFVYGSGLRISEALSLRPRDVDLAGLTVRVHCGKGEKARTVALMPDAVAYIQRWLDVRKKHGLTGRHPLFCTVSKGQAGGSGVETKPGRPLDRSQVHLALKRAAERAGIEKRVHLHGLRHSHALQLSRRRWQVNEIQQQLGHSSLGTTSVYLAHISAGDLVDRMKDEHWFA